MRWSRGNFIYLGDRESVFCNSGSCAGVSKVFLL